jgi:hypothetical protein
MSIALFYSYIGQEKAMFFFFKKTLFAKGLETFK